jgi:hypothetical protein
VGVWLLVPEHLRLQTWNLLRGWTDRPTEHLDPRLALQMVHEAALCVTGVRERAALPLKTFEQSVGLPFVATDQAIHELLNAHTIEDAQKVQVALGQIRRTLGHFRGELLAIDPHRMRSYSKRHMRLRQDKRDGTPWKCGQTFFCIDVETQQPIAFTTGTPGRTATQATPELFRLVADILNPTGARPLVLADTEHRSAELFEHTFHETPFDLVTPMSRQKGVYETIAALPPECFTPHWAGYATAVRPYRFLNGQTDLFQLIQRCGERPEEFQYKAFASTRHDETVEILTGHYPKRWNAEVFFNNHQALGWKRAGTLNLHIRYGKMTMSLLAQAALHQLRQRLGEPYCCYEASHFANEVLGGLDGDVRVRRDTIVVTLYNAPDSLRPHYENLPDKLEAEGVDPRIPWLFDFKLNFRFT